MSRHLVTLRLLSLASLGLLAAGCGDDDGVPQTCGDQAITGTEQCDGTELGGSTCRSIAGGYTGGTLGCTATCSFDTSGCTTGVEECGNGVQETGEDCDGTDLGTATCQSVGAFVGGTLACTSGCAFDTSACEAAPSCGDGVRNGSEACDGTDVGAATCETVGQYVGGTLGCLGDCTFDTSQCEAEPDCGNGAIDAPEQCDGQNLNGATCLTVAGGYVGGDLACAGDCTFDVSGCVAPACGDGAVNQVSEACDGTDLADEDCTTVGAFVGGDLACTDGCAFDTTGCIAAADCGNAAIDAPEQCDGTALGGATCVGLGGYVGGDLACADDCTFDETGCVLPDCGDGDVNQPSEACDGSDLGGETCATVGPYSGGTLTCTTGCAFDTAACVPLPYCGDDVVNQGSEDCDGADLDGQTCASVGAFAGGDLACTAGCLFDTSACDPLPTCGDGVVNQGSEHCDGSDLSGEDCTTVTGIFVSGSLACAADCTFDTSGCLTAAGEIAVVRQATSVPAQGLPLHAVYVTYLKRAVGSEPAGFFVQATAGGPALYVAVVPTTVDPTLAVGDLVTLTVRAVASVDGQARATAVDGYARLGAGYDVTLLTQEVTDALDLVSALDDYESELISVDVELVGALAAAGTGHVAADAATAGVPADADLRFRTPADVATALELEEGCLFTVTETPLWRYNAVAQISAWNAGEITNLVCPGPRVLSAQSTGDATVVITFSRTLGPDSVAADGSQVVFDVMGFDALAAVAVGNTLVVTTEPQTPGQTYEVVVDGTVTDTLGAGVDPAHDTATFTAASPVCTPDLVISQVYGAGGNSGAIWQNDFVELHNRSSVDTISLTGMSVQYASATGTTWNNKVDLAGTIPPGGYFLISLSGGTNGVALPTPDQTGAISMAAANGKVLLAATTTSLSGLCPTTDVIDHVSYGASSACNGSPTGALSTVLAALRNGSGCTDTDVNLNDFTVTTPAPRNSATAALSCGCE